MEITLQQLEQLGACTEGVKWFEAQPDHSLTALVEAAIANPKHTARDNEDFSTLGFANWGIVRVMSTIQRVRFSCFAARQVLKNYTDAYPDDNRVLAALEAAEAWADNPTARAAASAAFVAAFVAGYAADSAAAYAAASAADSAASAAAYAADSAASAASVADSAASAAAKNKMYAQILRNGVGLIVTEEKIP